MRLVETPPEKLTTESIPSLRGLVRDFNGALIQQMYFWGRDVIHPEGNLLVEAGFSRSPSEGLDGTSCYRLPFEGSVVELHGACVGRYEKSGPGFLFVRSRSASFLYDESEPPSPGLYPASAMKSGSISELHLASCRFLEWWLEYESWIEDQLGAEYRNRCFRAFRKLPRAKEWLPPVAGRKWLQNYAVSPQHLRRAKEWKRRKSER